MRTFIIDTDAGSDDAVALLMALRAPDIRIAAITSVAGNVEVTHTTRNACYCVELCGADVPVYAGADRPLLVPWRGASEFHGDDGLGDRGYRPQRVQPAPGSAIPALIEAIRANPGCVLVTLGPLTNIALALRQDPGIVPLVSRCVVMGGAATAWGNTNPVAEFNIWCDPESARIVFRSGMPVEMVGWELCMNEYALTPPEIEALYALKPLGEFSVSCNKKGMALIEQHLGAQAMLLPDAVTMAVALDPSIVQEMGQHYVDIETRSELTRGMTVVDRLNLAEREDNRHTWAEVLESGHRTGVVWKLDAARWKAMLLDLLRG